MQTFLPLPTFNASLYCLDNKRLGKQRVEAYQILRVLTGKSKGWANHPAVLMWRGHEIALYHYLMWCCEIWRSRGYKDTILDKIQVEFPEFASHYAEVQSFDYPSWYTDEFCLSHQSNLVRKDPEYYRKHFPDVPDDLPYVWPVRKDK